MIKYGIMVAAMAAILINLLTGHPDFIWGFTYGIFLIHLDLYLEK